MRTVSFAAVLCCAWTFAAAESFDMRAMERFAAGLFDRMDLDHDGRLTEQEHEHTQGGGFPVDYELLDLDGDGIVTKAEYLLAVRRYHPPHDPGHAI